MQPKSLFAMIKNVCCHHFHRTILPRVCGVYFTCGSMPKCAFGIRLAMSMNFSSFCGQVDRRDPPHSACAPHKPKPKKSQITLVEDFAHDGVLNRHVEAGAIIPPTPARNEALLIKKNQAYFNRLLLAYLHYVAHGETQPGVGTPFGVIRRVGVMRGYTATHSRGSKYAHSHTQHTLILGYAAPSMLTSLHHIAGFCGRKRLLTVQTYLSLPLPVCHQGTRTEGRPPPGSRQPSNHHSAIFAGILCHQARRASRRMAQVIRHCFCVLQLVQRW